MPRACNKAKKRLGNASNAHIIEAALFWLDGHFSGGNTGHGEENRPIIEELSAIYFSDYEHIVLIDDARCFGVDKDYLSIEELSSYI